MAISRKKIHEKLNAQFNTKVDFKSIKVQHQEQLEEKQRIIENLKEETSELTNEVATLKKDKAVLLDDLNNSKWMEDKVHSTAKQIYEDKIPKAIDTFKFPLDVFPNEIQNYMLECNDKLNASVDYLGCSFLWVLSTIIGNTRVLQVKSGWKESGVLWLSLIGKAGVGKTPDISLITSPLEKLNKIKL